jgi:actin-like ATPase involved in cell morphogenesis
MKSLTEEGIMRHLKEKHRLAIGERTAELLLQQIKALLDASIEITGRCYVTGDKKHIKVRLKSFLI